jgi:hypothetical protein
MDADTDRQTHPVLRHQAGIERSESLDQVEASTHSPAGVVFMSLGIAK